MSTALEDVCKILNLADEAKRAACNLRSGSRPGEWPVFAHSGRLESTSSGHCRAQRWPSQPGGKPLFESTQLRRLNLPAQASHSLFG